MGEEDMLKIKQSTSSDSPTENGNSEVASNPDSGNSSTENSNSTNQPSKNGSDSSPSGSGHN